jgi:hypothetical protein
MDLEIQEIIKRYKDTKTIENNNDVNSSFSSSKNDFFKKNNMS